jgi:hypothetical protein
MKKSYIIDYHSPDIDLQSFNPQPHDDFAFVLQLFVGIEGEKGEECFDIFVCTPKWIEHNYTKQTIITGLHTIIVQEYDFEKLKEAIDEIFCAEGATWQEIANRIGYYGRSEMDYPHWSYNKKSVRCGMGMTETSTKK